MHIRFKFDKKTLYAVIAAVLIIALCITVAVIRENREKQENAEKYKEMVEIVPPSQDENEENAEPTFTVNFEELKQGNPDIYAWIDIPDTVISYPMLRSETEDYYLSHNADKKSSAYGAIYTQNYNSDTFEDFNTVIYGHNMRNGTMFGTLKKYRNKEYFDNNSYINIYTPQSKLTYKIFAAYVYDDSHILYTFDFADKEIRKTYLADIFSGKFGGHLNSDVEVTEDDKIITLSTCTNVDSERYLVQAVLESQEDIGEKNTEK